MMFNCNISYIYNFTKFFHKVNFQLLNIQSFLNYLYVWGLTRIVVWEVKLKRKNALSASNSFQLWKFKN